MRALDELGESVGMRVTSMPIKSLLFRAIPPLSPCDVDCDEKVDLFIGPNSSGKSTVLRAMDVLLSRRVYLHGEYEDTGEEVILKDPKNGVHIVVSHDWTVRNPNFFPPALEWKTPLLYIPSVRVNLPPPGISPGTIDRTGAYGIYDLSQHEPTLYNPHLYYGNTENNPAFIDPEIVDAKSVFYGNRVEQALATFRKRAYLYSGRGDQFLKVIRIGYSCVRSICREVIYDDAPHPFIELEGVDDVSSSERVVHFDMGIVTTDNVLGEPLYAGALSSGTQGTLLWVWALALDIAYRYDFEDGWEKKPAILLIDEIENHLHPTWQRRVIPALLEHFPGLHIFATTHSPFVVAGLKAGQVHLLNRDPETGAVTATTNDRDVIGWTADEILRTMLGVDDPTDERTANAARELRQLRKEEYRSDPAEEEKRQERMRELRQLVDRDLLAGGPWKRQREIFEQQFAESLRKYRESQSLNQENS